MRMDIDNIVYHLLRYLIYHDAKLVGVGYAFCKESFTLLTYKDLVRFKKSNILRKRWN